MFLRLAHATEADLDGLCRELYKAAEGELCGMGDRPDVRYTGRGQTKDTIWRRVVPPNLPLLGRAAALAGSLQWLAIRFQEISTIFKRAGSTGSKGCAHRAALLNQLRSPTGQLHALMVDPDAIVWQARVKTLVDTGL